MRIFIRLFFLGAFAFLMTGCFRLDVNVKVNEDGSAVVTEKLACSETLLDLASASPKDDAVLQRALSKEGALERMAKMGEGVQFVSHMVTNEIYADALFKQATAVYKISDINKLRLVPPFPNLRRDPEVYMTFVLEPCFERKDGYGRTNKELKDMPGGIDLPGWMAVGYKLSSLSKPSTNRAIERSLWVKQEAPLALSPVKAEEIRSLLPVVRDMLRTFSVKVTLEGYDKLVTGWWYCAPGVNTLRDRDGTHSVSMAEILNLSGGNCDSFDHPLLADDAALLELVRGDWTGDHFGRILFENWSEGYKFKKNSRIPLMYTNEYCGRYIILPSEYFFQKYFVGKKYDDKFAPARSQTNPN